MASSADPDRVLGGLKAHEAQRLPERYPIAEELGRGGMAVVYRARDVQLNRDVALKILRDDLPVEPQDRARFRREAEAAARLAHPNVVTILDAGERFLVMELVRGRTLDRVLADPAPALPDRVRLLEKAARGVHHAHEHGIVHRDLKPSNILVSDGGEPKVGDFGIARLAGDRTALTQTGSVLGTPQYMAPEQVQGRSAEIGPRTDVYALGAILYETLTGRPPHRAETALELFAKIVGEEPRAPRTVAPQIPADLETIALKALEKDSRRRYPTAKEFADDLVRWREGAPILARPPSALYRWRKRLARRRGVVVTAAVGLLGILLALAILLPKLTRARRTLKLWSDISVVLSDAELYARAGDAGRSRARLDQGIAECRYFLGKEDSAEARYFLGRLLRARGRREEARAEFDRAVELNPRLGEARFERGILLVEKYGEAFTKIQAAFAGRSPTRADPTLPTLDDFERRFPILRQWRDQAIADLSVQVGESAYFREVDGLYGRAELARMRWELESARAGLLRVLATEPLHVPARLSLARSSMIQEDYDAAIDHATKALEMHQGSGAAYLIRSQASFWKTEGAMISADVIALRERCLADAEKAVELLEGAAESHAARGNIRRRSGDLEGALADYSRALEMDPEDAITYNHRGGVRGERKDLDGAIADFSSAVRISPTFATAYRNRALVLAQRGEATAALSDAEKAIEVAPPGWAYLDQTRRFIAMMRAPK